MVICSKCCDEYRLVEVERIPGTNRYRCSFECGCHQTLQLEESEAERRGYLADEETQETLHAKKFEIVQALIRQQARGVSRLESDR